MWRGRLPLTSTQIPKPQPVFRLTMGAGKGNPWLLQALAAAFVFAGYATLSASRAEQSDLWLPFALWLACSAFAILVMKRRLPGHDPLLLALPIFLSGWGLVAIERLAPAFADRQAIWLVISMLALLGAACMPGPLRWLRRYRYSLLASAMLLLLATIALGTNPSGFEFAPRLWLSLGSVYFQPSELMKVILVAFMASYLAEHNLSWQTGATAASPRLLGPMLLMWLLSMVILVWQRDLGTAMLFFIVFLLLLYLTSGDPRIIAGGLVLILLAGLAGYHLFDVVRLRVEIWLNPWPEADGRAYQIVQSLMAFAAGGIFGSGVGLGYPGYVPVAHSDFIFAAIAEEWGLLGVIGILSCLGALAWRGIAIALAHPGATFHKLLAVALSMTLLVQALMIMAGVLKLLPLTGVTLPFISYGGSSLLACHLMIGFLLRLSAGAR